MALFRKFFYRKPPDGLLEISDRVYVIDCCFTTDMLEEDEYKMYVGGIVGQLREHFPDASFMVFDFREGQNQSHIAGMLSEYGMTVMEYPRHYEGCPLLTMELIHHFLRSSENWLSLAQQNVLLMHCEQGGWPVLAFMLASFLLYRKQFSGEQKTLYMIHKQAPRELLHLMSPLDPMPSQLRYLQYVSRRNVGSQWPPIDRALTLDSVILRMIPDFDGEGGCRPVFRIYGQDPFMASDQTSKVLFSTPKRSKAVRHYKQEDYKLVKIDINCHVQGDVVLECINLDSDQEREEMMYRVMFNTAFIRSNILMLNRDDIDVLWNYKDRFPKDFRAEVIFSEMDAATNRVPVDMPCSEEKDGLPMEAFSKVQEIFSNVQWLDPKSDVALNVFQQKTAANILKESLDSASPRSPDSRSLLESALEKVRERTKLMISENGALSPTTTSFVHEKDGEKKSIAFCKPSENPSLLLKKVEAHELLVSVQRTAQSKIISPRVVQSPVSAPASSSPTQGSSLPISRYNSAPSILGITALLHDHDTSKSEEVAVRLSPTSPITTIPKVNSPFAPIKDPHSITAPPTHPPPSSLPPLPPPSIAPSPSPRPCLIGSPLSSTAKCSNVLPQPSPLPLRSQPGLPHPPTRSLPPLSGSGCCSSLSSAPPLSLPPPPVKTSANIFGFPPPPPPPSPSQHLTHPSGSQSSPLLPPPPPPPPPALRNSASSTGPPPPLPPPLHSTSGPPPLPPSPLCSTTGPPPPPGIPFKNNSTACTSPVPPPPAPIRHGASNGNIPPVPGPPAALGMKGHGILRISPRSQSQPRKANLKPYHWLKLTRVMQGSLWADTQKPDEAVKAPEFDISELESLFSAAAPISDNGGKGGKSGRRASGPKIEKVQLIELRRAYNCEIMLSKVKIPLPDLMSSVLALDESALDVDQVDNLIKFCPTKEEMELLKGYTGDKEKLGRCEKFFLELMKVPRVESKLRVFSFKRQFRSQVSDLRKSLKIINSAAEEVRSSVKLKRIMQTILSLGNALNHGTARGSAIGFRLDSLLKLTDTRSRNNKMTLMHYLCKVLAEKLPDLLDFPKDLVSLEAATKIQLKYLAEEMQAISKGLEKVVQELTASENDGAVSENFRKTLKDFLSFAEGEVRSLASLYSSVGRSADALALYFGEDPARVPFEQVVTTLQNFVRMFVRSHEENCKQLEFEKKRSLKEAENGTLKEWWHR